MAAGFVVIPFPDANGVSRNIKYWSSDGTITGDLTPAPLNIEEDYTRTGLKALIGLLNGYVDGLEGFTDGIEAKLDTLHSDSGTLGGYVDGLEGLIAAVQPRIASLDSQNLYVGATALTPKFAAISTSTSGDANTLVAAVTSKKIRALSLHIMAAGTVNAKFSSDPAGTPVYLTGLSYLVVNTGIVLPFNPLGWFESASGKALGVNLSAGVAIGGSLSYVEV